MYEAIAVYVRKNSSGDIAFTGTEAEALAYVASQPDAAEFSLFVLTHYSPPEDVNLDGRSTEQVAAAALAMDALLAPVDQAATDVATMAAAVAEDLKRVAAESDTHRPDPRQPASLANSPADTPAAARSATFGIAVMNSIMPKVVEGVRRRAEEAAQASVEAKRLATKALSLAAAVKCVTEKYCSSGS